MPVEICSFSLESVGDAGPLLDVCRCELTGVSASVRMSNLLSSPFFLRESTAKLIRIPTAQQTTWPAQKVMNVRGHRIWLASTLENCCRRDKGTSGAAYSIFRNKGEECYLYAKQSHKGMIFFF